MENGVKHDQEKPDWALLPLECIEGMVQVLSFGQKKYDRDNWKKIPNFKNRIYAALMRHITKWQKGEQIDQESGLHHLDHAMTNLMFLIWEEKFKEKEESKEFFGQLDKSIRKDLTIDLNDLLDQKKVVIKPMPIEGLRDIPGNDWLNGNLNKRCQEDVAKDIISPPTPFKYDLTTSTNKENLLNTNSKENDANEYLNKYLTSINKLNECTNKETILSLGRIPKGERGKDYPIGNLLRVDGKVVIVEKSIDSCRGCAYLTCSCSLAPNCMESLRLDGESRGQRVIFKEVNQQIETK